MFQIKNSGQIFKQDEKIAHLTKSKKKPKKSNLKRSSVFTKNNLKTEESEFLFEIPNLDVKIAVRYLFDKLAIQKVQEVSLEEIENILKR